MNQDALEREFWVGYERCKAKDYGIGSSVESHPALGSVAKNHAPSRQFTKLNFPHVPPQKIQVWA